MGKIDTEIIERYLDGEISSSRQETVASMIKDSSESGRYFDQNRRLGDLIRMSNQEKNKDVSFEGLADRVLNEIEGSPARLPASTRVNVWLKEFIEHRRALWIPAAAMSAAAVAALLILPLSGTSPTQRTISGKGITLHSTMREVHGSEIASVDFGTASGKTFSLKSATGGAVGVVWIEE